MSEEKQSYTGTLQDHCGTLQGDTSQLPNIKITRYGPRKNVIEMEDGVFVDIEGTNEVPEVFTQYQFTYVAALTGHTILRDLKGELLNIIESAGLPDKQERAIKRSVTNSLHEWHNRFKEDIELVTIKDDKKTVKVRCRLEKDFPGTCPNNGVFQCIWEKYRNGQSYCNKECHDTHKNLLKEQGGEIKTPTIGEIKRFTDNFKTGK